MAMKATGTRSDRTSVITLLVFASISFAVSALPLPASIRAAAATPTATIAHTPTEAVLAATPTQPAAAPEAPAQPLSEPEMLPSCDGSASPCEETALRSERVAVVRLASGQYQAVSDSRPRSHFDPESGKWVRPQLRFQADGSDQLARELPLAVTRFSEITWAGERVGVISHALHRGGGGVTFLTGRPALTTEKHGTLQRDGLEWKLEVTRDGLMWESEPIASKRGVSTLSLPYVLNGDWEPFAVGDSGAARNSVWQLSRPFLKGADGLLYPLCHWQTASDPQRLLLHCDDAALPDSALPYTIDPTSGPKFTGLCENVAGTGSDWTLLSRCSDGSNNLRSTSSVPAGGTSDYLEATDFGFSVNTIPVGATIDGVLVQWEQSASLADRIRDEAARLVKRGVIGATDKSRSLYWPATANEALFSYGGSTDLWGESLVPADVHRADFGAALRARNDDASFNRTAQID
jgi:hypothetical protein